MKYLVEVSVGTAETRTHLNPFRQRTPFRQAKVQSHMFSQARLLCHLDSSVEPRHVGHGRCRMDKTLLVRLENGARPVLIPSEIVCIYNDLRHARTPFGKLERAVPARSSLRQSAA